MSNERDFQQECQDYVDGIKRNLERAWEGNEDEINELQEGLDALYDEEPEEPDEDDFESTEEYDKAYENYEKAHEAWDKETDELQDKIDDLKNEGDLRSYFDDVLDIDYIVNSSKEYQSVRAWVTIGGPGVWIDTETATIELRWGSNSASAPISYNLRDEIDDIFREIYEIS